MMRFISALTMIVALTSCGASTSPTDLKSKGLKAGTYASEKAPMDFAWCAMPVYDRIYAVSPAYVRETKTGVEIVKTSTFLRNWTEGVIMVDAANGGSTVTGYATSHGFNGRKRIEEVETVIRECL